MRAPSEPNPAFVQRLTTAFLSLPPLFRSQRHTMHTSHPLCASRPSRRRRRPIRGHLSGPPPTYDPVSVEARVMAWARIVVCGLNLCPFAEGVLDSNTVRVQVRQASEERGVQAAVAEEISLLLATHPDDMSTSLLVLPAFAEDDFRRFHALCVALEDDIERDEDMVDEVMLACFHPRHEWAGVGDEDAALNFDKRAPYPVINFLRARVVDQYVSEGKTQRILEQNQETLERVGSIKLGEMYRSLMMDDIA